MAMDARPTPAWLKPRWIRLVIAIAPGAWAVVEALHAQWSWALMFAAMCVWGIWSLVVKFESGGPPKG